MITEARKVPDGTVVEADVCIVGAGAAGIAMARRLAGEDVSVCLLESGGFEYDEATQNLYKGPVTGRPYHELDVTRLRFFGGTTNHWSGWCSPLDPIDFEARPYLPLSGWRIRYEDLGDYFAEAADICQLPSRSFELADHQANLPEIYREPLAQHGLSARVWQLSPPTRFGETYGPEIEAAERVRCLLGANVVGIQMQEASDLVDHLRVKTLDGTTFSVKARAYVLAAGGIENARLLLQPTNGRPNGIGNGGDQLGRYFMLHPMVPIGTVMAIGSNGGLLRSSGEDVVVGGLGLTPEEQLRRELPNHVINVLPGRPTWVAPAAFGVLKRRVRKPLEDTDVLFDDVKFVLGDLDEIGEYAYARVSHRVSEMLGDGKLPPDLYTVLLRMEHLPNPDSRIQLADERDALGSQRAAVNWTFSEGEKEGIRDTALRFGEIVGAMSIGRFHLTDWLQEKTREFPNWIDGDYHHMGTTRMSDSLATGVCDWDCRVHDARNLYIAGSSVFPTGGSSNPTLSIIAMTLRLADHVLDDLSRPIGVRGMEAFDDSGAATAVD